jgi:predicted RND superfamily exporter protein
MEATVDSKIIKFDTKAEIYFNRTFVPLRFVSEALGASVGWNGENRTVTVDTKKEEVVTKEGLKSIDEMVKELEDEELKEIVRTVPNIQLERNNRELTYDTTKQFRWDTAEIRISYSDYHKNTLITVYPEIYEKDYSVLKHMFKIYYPTEFEKTYIYVSKVIKQSGLTEGQAEEFTYDGRSFACAKGEIGVSIYIGGKGDE